MIKIDYSRMSEGRAAELQLYITMLEKTLEEMASIEPDLVPESARPMVTPLVNKAKAAVAADPSWLPIATHPRTGERFDVLSLRGGVVKGIFWGQRPMGREFCLRGEQNVLSPVVVLTHWRKA